MTAPESFNGRTDDRSGERSAERPDGRRAGDARSPEHDRATKGARTVVLVCAAAAFAVLTADAVERVLAVPSLPAGIFREETAVTLAVEEPAAPRPIEQDPWIEHTVEESDYAIDAKPEPVKAPEPVAEPEPLPEPEPVVEPEPIPEPVVKEEPKPEPKLQPKPKPQPKPQPKPKAESKPAPQPAPVQTVEQSSSDAPSAASMGSAATGTSGGVGAGTDGTPGSGAAGLENQVVAEILAVIEAHKSYPRRARQTGQEGTVILAVRVDASGVIVGVEVETTATSALLNRAAQSAAKPLVGRKSPLTRALTLRVPVKFELTAAK